MKPHPEMPRWSKVAAALRRDRALTGGASEAGARPPFGFQARVVARAKEERREQSLALWRRWALRAACCTAGVFLFAFFTLRVPRGQGVGGIVRVPALEYPLPPAPE